MSVVETAALEEGQPDDSEKRVAPLELEPAAALFGGIALYYAGHVGFRLRNLGTINRARLTALVASLALIGVAVEVDALVALALAAGLTSAVILYEAIHFREARHRIRHQ
jgi:hypothetical protein